MFTFKILIVIAPVSVAQFLIWILGCGISVPDLEFNPPAGIAVHSSSKPKAQQITC